MRQTLIVAQECPKPVPGRERVTAAAMHVGSIFAPFVVPALVWAAFHRSAYISGHARKAFFEALYLKLLLVVVGTISLIYTAYSLYGHYQTEWRDFSMWPMLVRFALGWIALAILELVNSVLAIRQALRAFRGEWPARTLPVRSASG